MQNVMFNNLKTKILDDLAKTAQSCCRVVPFWFTSLWCRTVCDIFAFFCIYSTFSVNFLYRFRYKFRINCRNCVLLLLHLKLS